MRRIRLPRRHYVTQSDRWLSLLLAGLFVLAVVLVVSASGGCAPLPSPLPSPEECDDPGLVLSESGRVVVVLAAGEPLPFTVAPARVDAGAVMLRAVPLAGGADLDCGARVVALSLGGAEELSGVGWCAELHAGAGTLAGTVTARETGPVALDLVVAP